MLTKFKIQDKYRKFSLSHYSLYLPIPVAFDFVEECDMNNLLVIGIECFTSHGIEQFEPRSDLIADFSYIYSWKDSWAIRREACNSKAREFLNKLPNHPNLVAEFVLISQDTVS